MPQPLEILIFFDDAPVFTVPTNEEHRDILASAQIGDYVSAHISGQHHYGNVIEKLILQGGDRFWSLALVVRKPPTTAHIEKLLKRPA